MMLTVIHLLGSQLVRKRHAGTQEHTSFKMVFHFEITILSKSYIDRTEYILEQRHEKLNAKRTTRSNLYHVADQLQIDYSTRESASNMKE